MADLLIRQVRLIDGVSAEPRDDVDVVVAGGRITTIRPATPGAGNGPSAASEVDGRGATLLPGLIDAHAHYTFDPTEGSLQVIARRSDDRILADAERHATRAVRAGITTARGAGSIRGLELTLRDRIAAGSASGPRIVAAGTAVGSADGHGIEFGVGATGPHALADATRRIVAAGADVVKVVASEAAMLTTTGHDDGRTVFGRPELTDVELRAIVDTAHGLGRRVMAHAQDSESVVRCVRAGVDSIEHAWLANRAAVELMAEYGTTLVPTLVVTDVNRTLPGLTPAQRERQDLIEGTHRASTAAAIELRVPLAAGTDTGEVGVSADMVWREIAILNDHGATPMAAIRAATSDGARLLGIDRDVGSVEVGKVADLVLVDGDPLADLAVLRTPSLVIQDGRIVFGTLS
jgi:imidazolonepropionase-like amidohydrolase